MIKFADFDRIGFRICLSLKNMEVCVNNSTIPSSSSLAAAATPATPTPATPTTNNNEEDIVKPMRPKRDFRFKVIEVQNGPKWFVWPSRNRGSSEEVDENHNKEAKTENSDGACFLSTHVSQNGYGALRRSVVRQSKRKQDQDLIASRTASEPASARRMSTKKEKAITEPISQVSSMFKIISIDKKWESFDVTDDEEEEGMPNVVRAINVNEVNERRWTTSI